MKQHRRHILPSSLYAPHIKHCQYYTNPAHAIKDCELSLADPNGVSRAREPLRGSAGNSQLPTLGPGQYHDVKQNHLPPGIDRLMYPTPTVPSQPAQLPLGSTSELRRHQSRRRRQARISRNPIVDSPQYRQYRERQQRDSSPDDQVWPDILEDAFLDALLLLPHMHRRKFSYGGKPYGRNELISQYLWIFYKQSLPPGAAPDPNMRRDRKKVSSHIQVLKAFLRGHPAFPRLFPDPKGPKNGFEDSFKNDPTLIAISQGRLPRKRFDQFDGEFNQMCLAAFEMKPVTFFVLVVSPNSAYNVRDDRRQIHFKDRHEHELYNKGIVAHKFTGLGGGQSERRPLEELAGWRQRFPFVNQLFENGELNCNVIHMDVSLKLQDSLGPDSELRSRLILSTPGGHNSNSDWKCYTSLNIPAELNISPKFSPPAGGELCSLEPVSNETWIKLGFHAPFWAQAFSALRKIQTQHEEQLRNRGAPTIGPAREYLDQMSMFYDVQAQLSPGQPYTRRAVILWTFREVLDSEQAVTTWRYLDPPPLRQSCMSPSPHPSHYTTAAMHENLHSVAEASLHGMGQHSLFDPSHYNPGLQTPPHTAGLASPFSAPSFAYAPHPYDLSGENMSFVSNATLDSESTLVDHDNSSATASLESFLSDARGMDRGINMNVSAHGHNSQLGEYDHHGASWQLNSVSESFDTVPAWASYTVPSTTPALGWDGQDTQKSAWSDMVGDHGQRKNGVSVNVWGDEKGDWNEAVEDSIPVKVIEHDHDHTSNGNLSALGGYVQGGTEQKLFPWLDENHAAESGESGFENLGEPNTNEEEEGNHNGDGDEESGIINVNVPHGTVHRDENGNGVQETQPKIERLEWDTSGHDGLPHYDYAQPQLDIC